MKSIVQIIFFSIASVCYSQSDNSTFLIIDDQLHVDQFYVLPHDEYSRYKNEIIFDTTKIIRDGNYKIFMVSDSSTVVNYFFMKDSTGLNLGGAKQFLRRMNFNTGIGAEYNFAKLIADSLLNSNVHFFTEPPLSTEYKYELKITAWLDYPDSLNLLGYEDKRDQTGEYFDILYKSIHQEFSKLGKENIHLYSMMPGHVIFFIHLKTNSFPIEKLEKYNLEYIHKPKVRPRIFEFKIFEE